MSKRDQILNIFRPDAWLGKDDIAKASGVDPGMAGYYLKQLVDEGKLVARGTTGDRMWALAGAAATAAAPKTPTTPKKKAAKKRAPKKRQATRATPAAEPDAEELDDNVPRCLPAITADRRMVLVGGTEPLIFSVEQTQRIADLVFTNFEAA